MIAFTVWLAADAQGELNARITEEKYVAAAYLVVFLFVLIYVLIMATKVARLEREVANLAEQIRRRDEEKEKAHEPEAEGVQVG